jgi:hypothetical protein
MRLVVGLLVEYDQLRAVGVRGMRVLWGVNGALDSDTPLGAALTNFLETLPLGRFARPRVTVALGSSFAQTKRLAGLPPLGDERALARAVAEHAARFFLRNGIPLVTTSVRLDTDGKPWGAALQKPTVDTIVAACRGSRVRLVGVVPAADVCRSALDVSEVLAPLGPDAASFTTAYGAAVTANALMWRAASVAEESAPRWRMVTAVSAAVLCFVAWAIAPVIAARVAERRAIAHQAHIATRTQAEHREARELGLVTYALDEVSAFDRGRRPVTLIMASLARVLPEGGVLLVFHIDSAGGSIVALAPRAGALLGQLEHVPGLAAPEISGPVTRETTGGREVERATVRFRWVTP